jgi:thioredoxin-like negative regulator of GroEL
MVNTSEALKQLISENEMTLVYFGSESCNVCTAMKPKIKELLKNYPKIKSAQVDVEKSVQISAEYNIFTIPVILLYIEGKETIREARSISIQDINERIEKYYNMLFE